MLGRNLTRIPCALALTGAFVALGALTSVGSIGIGWSFASAEAEGPAKIVRAAACYSAMDGTAPTGVRVGSNPTRWEYGNSPYVGARFDQCRDVVYISYGGYTGITHYNIRLTHANADGPVLLKQFEVGPGPARRYTLSGPTVHYRWLGITVQGCRRGTGLFPTSSCTRWSPTIGFPRMISPGAA